MVVLMFDIKPEQNTFEHEHNKELRHAAGLPPREQEKQRDMICLWLGSLSWIRRVTLPLPER